MHVLTKAMLWSPIATMFCSPYSIYRWRDVLYQNLQYHIQLVPSYKLLCISLQAKIALKLEKIENL